MQYTRRHINWWRVSHSRPASWRKAYDRTEYLRVGECANGAAVMPVLESTQTKKIKVIDGFICNKCKKEFRDDIWEIQEMFRHRIVGGFGSVWGDGDEFEIVLCQRCAQELLYDYAELIGSGFIYYE